MCYKYDESYEVKHKCKRFFWIHIPREYGIEDDCKKPLVQIWIWAWRHTKSQGGSDDMSIN